MDDMIPFLIELRRRLIWMVAVFGVVFIVAAIFANSIYYWLALPILRNFSGGTGLIATAVPAPFLVPFKSAAVATLFVTMPFFLYQLWRFVAPALYNHERKLVWLLLLTSSVLFYVGVLFAYFVVLPIVFKFFLYIAPQGVEVKPDISLYFSFVLKMFLSFGVTFELPIAIMLLVWTGACEIESLKNKRPYVIVIAFVAGMLLTPPDVISQILLAIPIYLLYELGLLMARLVVRRREKQ